MLTPLYIWQSAAEGIAINSRVIHLSKPVMCRLIERDRPALELHNHAEKRAQEGCNHHKHHCPFRIFHYNVAWQVRELLLSTFWRFTNSRQGLSASYRNFELSDDH